MSTSFRSLLTFTLLTGTMLSGPAMALSDFVATAQTAQKEQAAAAVESAITLLRIANTEAATSFAQLQKATEAATRATILATNARAQVQARVSLNNSFIAQLTAATPLQLRASIAGKKVETATADAAAAAAEQASAASQLAVAVAFLQSKTDAKKAADAQLTANRAAAEYSRYILSYVPFTDPTPEALAQVRQAEENVNLAAANVKAAELSLMTARSQLNFFSQQLPNANRALTAARKFAETVAYALQMIGAKHAALVTNTELEKSAELIVDSAKSNLGITREDRNSNPYQIAKAQSTLIRRDAQVAVAQLELKKSETDLATAIATAETLVAPLTPNLVATSAGVANQELAIKRLQLAQAKSTAIVAGKLKKSAMGRSKEIMLKWRAWYDADQKAAASEILALEANATANTSDFQIGVAKAHAEQTILQAQSRVATRLFSDNSLETYYAFQAEKFALTLDNSRIQTQELSRIEAAKVLAARDRLHATQLKVDELQVNVKVSEAFLEIEKVKLDSSAADIQSAEIKVSQARAALAIPAHEVAAANSKLNFALSEELQAKQKVDEANRAIEQAPANIKSICTRLSDEDKRKALADAEAVHAREVDRQREWDRMAKLYDHKGFATSRYEAAQAQEVERQARLRNLGGDWVVMAKALQERDVSALVERYAGISCQDKNNDSMRCLVCNAWFEAQNQSMDGMLLSARTVMTRYRSGAEDSVCGAVYHNKWYSWVLNPPDSNRDLLLPSAKSPILRNVVEAASLALHEQTPYILNHYYADYVQPPWASDPTCKMTTVKIDDHFACYLPLDNADNYQVWELQEMLQTEPSRLNRAKTNSAN